MSLPTPWIDRIFERLTVVYGQDFTGRWKGMSIADVKSAWGHELAPLRDRSHAIGWALQHLPPDRPPNVLQFRDLCYQAPGPDLKPLPSPKADAAVVERVLAEVSKLTASWQPQQKQDGMPKRDPRQWAKDLIERHKNGDTRPLVCVKMAEAAMSAATDDI